VIFVTLGTHETPFARLVDALALLPQHEELVVQHGSSPPGPAWSRSVPYLSFEEMAAHVRAARVVVSHAGVGSILIAVANEKRPLVVPRLHAHGEHVDDHQLSLARRLHAVGLVTSVEDPADLADAVARSATSPVRLPPAHKLPAELRAYLTSELAGRPRPAALLGA
jgi:UDP-N-acetylglucosamine--N-acetylmuramyl-(pentapeptide) pyrophosphoryl-undecaprenol N-acetylglucosamine transferase